MRPDVEVRVDVWPGSSALCVFEGEVDWGRIGGIRGIRGASTINGNRTRVILV